MKSGRFQSLYIISTPLGQSSSVWVVSPGAVYTVIVLGPQREHLCFQGRGRVFLKDSFDLSP